MLLLALAACSAEPLPELACDPGAVGTQVAFAGSVISGGTMTDAELWQSSAGLSHFEIRDDCAFVVRPTLAGSGSWTRTYVGSSDLATLQDVLEPLLSTARDRLDTVHASVLTLEDPEHTLRVEGTQALFLPVTEALAALGTITTSSTLEVALFRTDAEREVIPWPFEALPPSTAPQQVPANEVPTALAVWPARSAQGPQVRLDDQLYTLALRETVDLLAL